MGLGTHTLTCKHDSVVNAGNENTQSYGGFMSSKVVEADAGIHSLAMAVAVRPSIAVTH
jgi:hypothetical protein